MKTGKDKIGEEHIEYEYSAMLPELLETLNVSLFISTLRANHLLAIGFDKEKGINHFSTPFIEPYGIAQDANRFAIAAFSQTVFLEKSKSPINLNQIKKERYKPTRRHLLDQMKIHDLHFGTDDLLWAVNSQYSCLCTLNPSGHFKAHWKPHFIDELRRGDRCHLNGLAMKNKKPVFISALSQDNEADQWRQNIMKKGILMDIESNEIILSQLPIPHTPRIYEDQVLMLLSGTGAIVSVDVQSGTYETIARLPGFVRGMTRLGEYLFVGLSRPRKASRSFKQLEIPYLEDKAGISVLHLPSGKLVAKIVYNTIVEDIYDVLAYRDKKVPEVQSPWFVKTKLVPSIQNFTETAQRIDTEPQSVYSFI